MNEFMSGFFPRGGGDFMLKPQPCAKDNLFFLLKVSAQWGGMHGVECELSSNV